MRPNASYLGYRAGSILARALPGPAVSSATRVLGTLAAATMADRRMVVERNLRRLHGPDLSGSDLRRMVGATFESYSRYWVESFRLPGTSLADLDRGMIPEGYEHLTGALDAGSGVVLAMPHLGGWEWAAFWLAKVKHHTVTAVVQPVEPPELAEWFLGLRRQFGLNVVPLSPQAGAECLRALKANEVLCLLCDRDINGGGVEVEFFGERTTMPGGPATLALRTGAPLLPTAVYFDGARHRGVALPSLDVTRRGSLRADVARLTQELAYALEAMIREAPDQWHLMQPNWPSDHEALLRGQ